MSYDWGKTMSEDKPAIVSDGKMDPYDRINWQCSKVIVNGFIHTHCKHRAKQNGFRLEPGSGNNTINIVAEKEPYGKDVVIARLYDWSLVEMFFIGYEQGKMETNIIATLAKGKKT
jgi:hypothetical protein